MLDQVLTMIGQRLTRDELAALLAQVDGTKAATEQVYEAAVAYFEGLLPASTTPRLKAGACEGNLQARS